MKKFLIYSITILVFFIGGILIANFVIMPSIVHHGRVISVPNVCNLTLEGAIERLKQHDLDGLVTERRYDRIIEEGEVIIQDPLPNTKVKKGRIINLTISLGPETIKIPHLRGVDIEKGKLILKRLGLVIENIDFLFSDSIAKDKIIKTIPEAEIKLKKGDVVELIVSKGLILTMPNLISKSLVDAKVTLRKMGLVLGEVKEVEGSGVKGSIIVQNPEPEKIVNTGDTIRLMVIK